MWCMFFAFASRVFFQKRAGEICCFHDLFISHTWNCTVWQNVTAEAELSLHLHGDQNRIFATLWIADKTIFRAMDLGLAKSCVKANS